MTTTERDLTDGGIRELWTAEPIRRKLGHEVRVAVKDAGHGPAIDLREYFTGEDWRPEHHRVVGGSTRKPRRGGRTEAYVGPTRSGFWLSVDQAEALYQALGEAITTAVTTEVVTDDR